MLTEGRCSDGLIGNKETYMQAVTNQIITTLVMIVTRTHLMMNGSAVWSVIQTLRMN